MKVNNFVQSRNRGRISNHQSAKFSHKSKTAKSFSLTQSNGPTQLKMSKITRKLQRSQRRCVISNNTARKRLVRLSKISKMSQNRACHTSEDILAHQQRGREISSTSIQAAINNIQRQVNFSFSLNNRADSKCINIKHVVSLNLHSANLT